MSTEEINAVERDRKFSRRARAYTCAYFAFAMQLKNDRTSYGANGNSDTALTTISLVKIEGMVKKFKCHRCALDFDTKFIQAAVRTDDSDE